MRIVIMFGLEHVERHIQPNEAARLLRQLAETVSYKLTPGTSIILKDAQGNRVGIADIHP